MIPELSPPDACPQCDPGIPPASLPVGPVTETDGGRVADYECSCCGIGWTAWFDEFGWVVERLTAPVVTREAAA